MEFVCLKGQLFSRNSMFGYELPVRPEIGTQLMWAGAFREAYEIYSRYMEYTQKRNLPMDPALRVANAFLELSLGFYETVEKSLEWSQSNDLKSHLQMLQSALLLTRGDFNQASQIGEAAYTHILAIPDHRVSAFAASLVSMAHYRLEHAQLSRRYLLEALAIIEQTQNIIGLAFGLNYAALLLAEAGDLEAAVAVQACIADHPQVRNSIWLADLFGKPIAALGAQLDPDIRKKALRRGQDCQPVEVVTQMKDCLQADDDFTAGLESFARIMTG